VRKQFASLTVFPQFSRWRVEKEICCHTKMCLMMLVLSAAVGCVIERSFSWAFSIFPAIFLFPEPQENASSLTIENIFCSRMRRRKEKSCS